MVTAFALLALLAILPSSAEAAFPGQNGRIVFSDTRDDPNPSGCHPNCNFELYSVNPDGTGVTRLTNDPGSDVRPAWSPDGQKLVFNRYTRTSVAIVVMNADGTGQTSLGHGWDPSWSPDGTRIVFNPGGECPETGGIWTMNSDGTGRSFVACGPPVIGDNGEGDPAWSPDGGLIAFTADRGNYDIFTVEPDGTNRTNLTTSITTSGYDNDANWTPDAAKIAWGVGLSTDDGVWTMNRDGSGKAKLLNGENPAYSPDGTKIVVSVGLTMTVYNADGSGATPVTTGLEPDWQPIPINSYPRPKGATPFRASLTTAYAPCASPDRQHGPPLAFSSCSGPDKTSAHLTVGTGDSNGLPARNEGYLLMRVQPGIPSTSADEADVELDFFLDDVFTNALADYTGELRARVPLRITDKDNTPHPGGPGAGTTVEIPLELVAGCTPVADPQEGSSCATTTTADALAPGTVNETRRSIWALGRVEVYDGGADGDAHTPAGDTLFATQGVFVP